MTNTEELKQKRELWLRSYSDTNINSITRQLIELSIIITDFRVINEARRLASAIEGGGVQLNGMLHNLLNRTFYDSVLFRIRKLTEDKYLEKSNGKGKDESVISLVSLLNDIKSNHLLLTRRNLFDVEELEYDYDKLRNLEIEYCNKMKQEGNTEYIIPLDIDPCKSIERHCMIDKLCKVQGDSRSESDCLDETVIVSMIDKIKENLKEVKNLVDKEIAHAATQESKREIAIKPISITEIVDAHILLANVANFIQHAILNKGTTDFYPLELNKFQYIEKPLVIAESIPQLEMIHKDLLKEVKDKTIDFDRVSDIDAILNQIFV